MNPTSLASAARILWRLLEHHRHDPETLFREAGLDPSMLNESRARFVDKCTRAAWRAATQRIDNPWLGLLAAEQWRPTDLDALPCAFLASRRLPAPSASCPGSPSVMSIPRSASMSMGAR
jgi:hypothetical protein